MDGSPRKDITYGSRKMTFKIRGQFLRMEVYSSEKTITFGSCLYMYIV